MENLSPVTEKDPREVFLESYREKIEELRNIFQTNDFETFLTLPEKLKELELPESLKRGLPDDWLELFVDPSFATGKEEELRQLPEENGIYLSSDERGGGDFWEKRDLSGGVGQVSTKIDMADVEGHGANKIYPKAILLRFIDLYRQQPPDKQTNIFTALDKFWRELPIASSLIEYREVSLINGENGEVFLEIEGTGDPVIFIRDAETGTVEWSTDRVTAQLLGPEDAVRGMVVEENYHFIGLGLLESDERLTKKVSLPKNTDVYMCSDGLFELPVGAKDYFKNHFVEFCNQHRSSSPDEFRHALLEVIKQARAEQRQEDDITVLVLHVKDGKKV